MEVLLGRVIEISGIQISLIRRGGVPFTLSKNSMRSSETSESEGGSSGVARSFPEGWARSEAGGFVGVVAVTLVQKMLGVWMLGVGLESGASERRMGWESRRGV